MTESKSSRYLRAESLAAAPKKGGSKTLIEISSLVALDDLHLKKRLHDPGARSGKRSTTPRMSDSCRGV